MIKKYKNIIGFLVLLAPAWLYLLAIVADYTIGDKDGIVFYKKLHWVLGVASAIGLVAAISFWSNKTGRIRFYLGIIATIAALGITEIYLRVNNKIASTISQGDFLIKNDTQQIKNNPKILDSVVIQRYNNYGLKGPSFDTASLSSTKIVFMGNSVAACGYLNTGEDWPLLVGTLAQKHGLNWIVNNGAMVGQSSFGNLQMLKQYILPLKPNYVLLQSGFTDDITNKPNYFDSKTFEKLRQNTGISKFNKYSYIAKLYTYLNYRSKSEQFQSNTNSLDFATAKYRDNDSNTWKKHREYCKQFALNDYKNRIIEFITLCKKNNIKCILITHPIFVGQGKDPVTGGNLETVLIYDKFTGAEMQSQIELFNAITRQLAQEYKLPLIDLYNAIPRSSEMFYDHEHVTKKGSYFTSQLVFSHLNKIINGTK